MAEPSPVSFAGASADAPIRLAGPPDQLAGQVRLSNAHSSAIVLRDAGVSDSSGRLAQLPARHSFAPVVLRPSEERAVPLVIGIDPNTAPGEYHVELDVMGQRRPAVLAVAQNVRLRLDPKRVVVLGDSVQPWRAQLMLTNEGNVPLPIGPIADVDLRDDVAQVRDLRGVVGPLLADVPRKLEDFVAVLLAVLPPQGPVVARLRVRTPDTPMELAPGHSQSLEVELSLLSELPANGRYRGRVPVLTEDLEFIVISPARSAGDGAAVRDVAAEQSFRDDSRDGEPAARSRKKGGKT
jgi:hypothetical protein